MRKEVIYFAFNLNNSFVILQVFLSSADLFSKLTFSKKNITGISSGYLTIRIHFDSTDLGPNCFQSLSADPSTPTDKVLKCILPYLYVWRFRLKLHTL